MCSNYKLSILKMSDRTTLKFLDCYRAERSLWNPHDKKYRNKSVRSSALKRISDKMNIEGFGPELVQQKFKNLRSSYCQELKKIRTSALTRSSEDEELYQPSVCWFDKMDAFIKPFVQHRETRYTMVSQSPESFVSTETHDRPETPAVSEDIKPDVVFLNKNSSKPPENHTVRHQEQTIPAQNHPSPKRQRTHPHENPNSSLMEKIHGLCHASSHVIEKKEDLYEHYGKYIAAILRGLPPQRSLNLQRQIHELIYEEQMLNLVDTSPPNEPSSSRSLVECCMYPSTSTQDDEICVS